jgi:hypothetical protein
MAPNPSPTLPFPASRGRERASASGGGAERPQAGEGNERHIPRDVVNPTLLGLLGLSMLLRAGSWRVPMSSYIWGLKT